MNFRLSPLALGLALSAGMAVLVTGCSKIEEAPSAVPAPAETTVGMKIDDAVVTTRVKAALLDNQELKGFDIKVETRKGVVQLSGFIENQSRIDQAVSIARSVEGVEKVENSMTLKDGKVTVGNKIDDTVITGRVKSALLSDSSIKSSDIAVVTSKGEVQLSGFVDNRAQIDRAIEVVRAVEGVERVVNEMSIKK